MQSAKALLLAIPTPPHVREKLRKKMSKRENTRFKAVSKDAPSQTSSWIALSAVQTCRFLSNRNYNNHRAGICFFGTFQVGTDVIINELIFDSRPPLHKDMDCKSVVSNT
ncbi:hypothetical protein LOAG_01629 [Loa loa]|uniref:Secreted protein n=1 Tax=Loa loa TaxID=7209 RepID=A0A1I7VVW8_LOALO|nr:hypothetical protein LOAG_01629 [Loa loa]EFO26847.1 hypothetical protein LOAG_01629 [Loa loa]